jgi:transposase
VSDPLTDRQVRRRLVVLRHVEEVTGNVAMTCRYFGISRQLYYVWLRRYREEGVEGLRDRSRRSKLSPRATPVEVVEKILYLRQQYHFGPEKIVMYLHRYHDVTVSKSGVWRILKRLELNRLPASQRHKHHDRRWRRYEKPLPGHRVQIDVKFIQPLPAAAANSSTARSKTATKAAATTGPKLAGDLPLGYGCCGSTRPPTRRPPSSSSTTSWPGYRSASRPSKRTTAPSSAPASTGMPWRRACSTSTSSPAPHG